MNTKQIIDDIMELKPIEKMYLLEIIVESLNKPNEDIQKIWLEEAKERLLSHRAGKTKGVPIEQIINERI